MDGIAAVSVTWTGYNEVLREDVGCLEKGIVRPYA